MVPIRCWCTEHDCEIQGNEHYPKGGQIRWLSKAEMLRHVQFIERTFGLLPRVEAHIRGPLRFPNPAPILFATLHQDNYRFLDDRSHGRDNLPY